MVFHLPKAPEDKEDGFTLFEVLASFVLFSLFLSRFVPALVQVRTAQIRAEQRAEAYLVGIGKLHEVLYQAELSMEGQVPGLRSHYTWSFQEEKSGDLLVQTLMVKWKDHPHERKVELQKRQVGKD